jgi:flagellar motor switch protein FliM
MTQPDLLSQDEIDALLMGESDPAEYKADESKSVSMQPYNPATQHRIIRDRWHSLDMINERFSRSFRFSLFQLLKKNADITVKGVKFKTYSEFAKHIPMPSNLNLISMKPLRGTGLIAFPPSLIYMVVDNLFGGEGRFMKSEGREFTNTEQRIIIKIIGKTLECYNAAWKPVCNVDIEYVRSEMQARFATVTSSANDIIVDTTFHLELGNFDCDFNIALPYSMLEPIRKLLINPPSEVEQEDEDAWNNNMSSEIQQSNITIKADFVNIDSTINNVMSMVVGDILDIELPKEVVATVDGIPVLACGYGSSMNGTRALEVKNVINHKVKTVKESPGFVAGMAGAKR